MPSSSLPVKIHPGGQPELAHGISRTSARSARSHPKRLQRLTPLKAVATRGTPPPVLLLISPSNHSLNLALPGQHPDPCRMRQSGCGASPSPLPHARGTAPTSHQGSRLTVALRLCSPGPLISDHPLSD